MPLHLLGKKSWNVYNQTNIDKVRHDEARAQAEEEAEEQHQQEIDAARRLAILRGADVPPTPLAPDESAAAPSKNVRATTGDKRGERKLRKRRGEDDTDFEVRVAKQSGKATGVLEEAEGAEEAAGRRHLSLRKETTRNAPLVDARGHIDLFPQDPPPMTRNKTKLSKAEEREARAEQTRQRKEKQAADQVVMKLSNAAGFGKAVGDKAWYEKSGRMNPTGAGTGEKEDGASVDVATDVWGNADPRRTEREQARIVRNDPLALMKAGSRKVRAVERERARAREERDREVEELRDGRLEEEERRARRKRKYGTERPVSLVEGLGAGDRGSDEGAEKRRRREERAREVVRDREGVGRASSSRC